MKRNKWDEIFDHYRLPEPVAVQKLLEKTIFSEEQFEKIEQHAVDLIQKVRQQKLKAFSIESFLQMHQLSSQEGLAMMCLAEALLRIPDSTTKTQFIRDKITSGDWTNQNNSDEEGFIARLTNLGLLATSKVLSCGFESQGIFATIASLTRRFGEPVIRQIMAQAVKIMGQQFVTAETIEKAIARAPALEDLGYRYSYDMLGEGARTKKDAQRYLESYLHAATIIGHSVTDKAVDVFSVPSLSVKLSALHPRYELAKHERVMAELLPNVLQIAQKCKELGIGLTIDAEETERLTLSLKMFDALFSHPDLAGWDGLGLAVQAYQKRAPVVIDWLIELAERNQKRMGIRLVKGAYWDSEIKKSQERGLSDYPVYTQKIHTDLSYLTCANKMLDGAAWIYPQFATHNAYTVAAIQELARSKDVQAYEFQKLHGMGESLYQQITDKTTEPTGYPSTPCRIYAPVGEYRDLLAYLVRRLLENGANSSFVNQIHDPKFPISRLITNPIYEAEALKGASHPAIPLPKDMLLPHRDNSIGLDLWNEISIKDIEKSLASLPAELDPVLPTPENVVHQAVDIGCLHYEKWSRTSVENRALIIERFGLMLQQNCQQLMNLLVKEAGKTVPDAVSEIREAIDFCYYYANQARSYQTRPHPLPGPTGEVNQLSYHSRGVFVCISPWNFPLAIFVGQVVAALVTGNCVIAKTAEQTPRVAQLAIDLAYQAGIPQGVLQFIKVPGVRLSEVILQDPRIAGVAFTGSTDAARHINMTIAQRNGPIIPLIAETGGINVMIVDSSALSEQVVVDIMTSAFQSAGQRCSSLRLLLVQNDIADYVLEMLKGAMAELELGDPVLMCTDVGPVIDARAKDDLLQYVAELEQNPDHARLLYRCELPESLESGNFVAPQLWQLSSVRDLTKEIFGPILHLVSYKGEYLDQVLQDINSTGYGLTLGLHSRLESTIQQVYSKARVGNIYVNRNMIGAVVGVQPFGGEGLSGTGPKAGGPNYLLRFMAEKTFTQDTTAAGGNASLLAVS
ncbi:MAG: bifunctional proline dehydrogenase/L-glutamate gamma-semialdehyde dehydrogenase PutA [Alphaproteobacteria bacterium]|nr:bifunctional proline dehydrogenase/L-glutamate gamma-semialdehyde dehydrogenase PutA [Alphaproteobacteria bacterium]